MTTDKMLTVSKTLREAFNMGNNVPATWIEMFIMVMTSNGKGVRAQEVKDTLGMSQGIVSRAVSLLSLNFNPETKKMEGKDIYVKELDLEYKHQVRIFLSKEGKALAAKVGKLLQ